MPRKSITDFLDDVDPVDPDTDPSDQSLDTDPDADLVDPDKVDVEGDDSEDDSQVDASEDSTEEPDSPTPDIQERLRQFGMETEVPDDLPEEAVSWAESILDKADERVRGFQSQSDKKKAQAEAYELIAQHPLFPKAVEFMRKGQFEEEEKSEPEELPEDPHERFNVLVERAVDDRFRELEESLGVVTNYVGNQTWEQFAEEHPDARELAPVMRHYMDQYPSMSAEDALQMARAKNFDPETERQTVREDEIKARAKELTAKGKLSTSPKKSSRSQKKSTDILEIGRNKGRRAALLESLKLAEEDAGIDL